MPSAEKTNIQVKNKRIQWGKTSMSTGKANTSRGWWAYLMRRAQPRLWGKGAVWGRVAYPQEKLTYREEKTNISREEKTSISWQRKKKDTRGNRSPATTGTRSFTCEGLSGIWPCLGGKGPAGQPVGEACVRQAGPGCGQGAPGQALPRALIRPGAARGEGAGGAFLGRE